MEGPRPCPHVTCRHHLDVEKRNGAIGHGPTCSLDVADEGEHTLEEVGEILGVTRERVRQLQSDALGNVRPIGLERGDAALFAHADGSTFDDALDKGEGVTTSSPRQLEKSRQRARLRRARARAAQ